MVMHARKTQRMNDGYFEKHQTHPYQNSKYSSKGYGSSSDRYERIRDSPNGNYRSDSPDSQSPRERDRSYQSKSSYLQKIREKERENRDYKTSRDKYSGAHNVHQSEGDEYDCARSPKDKRNRESEHRTNNDRNDEKTILHPIKVSSQNLSRDRKPMHSNSIDKRDDRERVTRVGDWSEHVSSSGKKYYYNCKTEVSQWEKPREWIEKERDRFKSRDRDRDRDLDRCYSRTSTRHDKHSNSKSTNSSSSGGGGGGGGSSSKDNSRDSRHWSGGGGGGGGSSSSRDDPDVSSKDHNSRSTRTSKHASTNDDVVHQSMQDMDISPGDSTPTSELSYGTVNTATGDGPVLLANALPRLLCHPLGGHVPSTPGGGGCRPESSPQTGGGSVTVTTSNAPGPPPPHAIGHCDTGDKVGGSGMTRSVVSGGEGTGVHTSISIDTNHTGGVEGPPTPTHSETIDCVKGVSVPINSPPGSLSSLQGMSSSLQALRPQGPTLTPSLANYYRDDLVNHVRGWPAEILEKQAQKLADEAHIMSSIQCSKVSAELKSARSIVRLTEIQATLQEQRILFLRQQIKELEELKSQNSFMSDDS